MTSKLEDRGIGRWNGRMVDAIRVKGILEKNVYQKSLLTSEMKRDYPKKTFHSLYYTMNKIKIIELSITTA